MTQGGPTEEIRTDAERQAAYAFAQQQCINNDT